MKLTIYKQRINPVPEGLYIVNRVEAPPLPGRMNDRHPTVLERSGCVVF